MGNSTYKLFVDKMGATNSTEYIGRSGEIFYNPLNGASRISDGITVGGNAIGDTGSFYSTQTQYVTANRDGSNNPVNPVNPQPTEFTFNNTDSASTSGISIVSNSRITFANAGTYNIQFSAQLRLFINNASAESDIAIWLRKNNADVADSASFSFYDKYDAKKIEAWNLYITVAAGDYCQLVWWDSTGKTQALYQAAYTSPVAIPAVPSIILTANRVR